VNLLASLIRIAFGVLTGFGIVLSLFVHSSLGLLFFLAAGFLLLQGVRR